MRHNPFTDTDLFQRLKLYVFIIILDEGSKRLHRVTLNEKYFKESKRAFNYFLADVHKFS